MLFIVSILLIFMSIGIGIPLFFGLLIFVILFFLLEGKDKEKEKKSFTYRDDKEIYMTIDENDQAHFHVVPKGLPHDGIKVSPEKLEDILKTGKLEVKKEEWESLIIKDADKKEEGEVQ